ncbi:hypothetical protein [Methylomonas sp. AM2-LC]|uniref:hypothetical protein n=1 Tax=Methylomonas sp. AM2-LC TaxID=3153301 RepID=UPI0032649114
MKRSSQPNTLHTSIETEIAQRAAFHEAGHAAAIYLENNRKNLPSLYFQIHIQKQTRLSSTFSTQICGGRQIDDLFLLHYDAEQKEEYTYQTAYEADIVNFLAGSLAEAKYVALRDNEIFNINLLKPDALINYGGRADLQEVKFYLEFFIPFPEKRITTLNALFVEAFTFVDHFENWQTISALAKHILNSDEEYIRFEQVKEVLDKPYQYHDINCL